MKLSEWKQDDRAAATAFKVFAIAVAILGFFASEAHAENPPTIGGVIRVQANPDKASCLPDVEDRNSVKPLRVVLSTRDEDERLHAIADRVLDVVCGQRIECRDARVFDVIQGVSDLLSACKDEGATEQKCMALIVTATAESGFRRNPGCGVSEVCASTCDELENGEKRRSCMIECARTEGSSLSRARACNDGGTSRGPFQMKAGTVSRCGDEFSPHDFYGAGRCYLKLVQASEDIAARMCKVRKGKLWQVAWKRVGVGPFERGTTEPTCTKSRYAKRGVEWLSGK